MIFPSEAILMADSHKKGNITRAFFFLYLGLAAKANIPARDQLTSLPHRCWNRLPGFAIQNTSSPHVQSLYSGSVGQISVFICFIARNFSEMNVRYDISGFNWINWTYPTPGAHQSLVGTRVINHFYIFLFILILSSLFFFCSSCVRMHAFWVICSV